MVYILLRTNRTFTDELFPFFEIIYALEVLFTLLFFFLLPFSLSMLWNAQPLHRNLRLSLCNLVIQGLLGTTARLVLVYNLYVGDQPLDERPSVIAASVVRCEMIEAFVGVFYFFAFERVVATLAWSWYEKASLRTLFVFAAVEGGACTWSWSWSIALVFEFINSKQLIVGSGVWLIVGAAVAVFVTVVNYRATAELKGGAQINQYSVARTFQIRENMMIIKALIKIGIRVIILGIPVGVLAAYLNILSGDNDDKMRLVSRALFDLFISIYPPAIISYIPLSDPIFERSLKRTGFGKHLFDAFSIAHFRKRNVIDQKIIVNETDLYFDMLAFSLNGPHGKAKKYSQT